MTYPTLYQQDWIRDSLSITLEEKTPRLEDVLSDAQKEIYYVDSNAWKKDNTKWKQIYIDPFTMRRNNVVVIAHLDCATGSTYGTELQPFLDLGTGDIPLMKMAGFPNATSSSADNPAYPTAGLKYYNRSIDLIDNQNNTTRLVGAWIGYSDWELVQTGTIPST